MCVEERKSATPGVNEIIITVEERGGGNWKCARRVYMVHDNHEVYESEHFRMEIIFTCRTSGNFTLNISTAQPVGS